MKKYKFLIPYMKCMVKGGLLEKSKFERILSILLEGEE